MDQPARLARFAEYFSLERNVTIASAAVFSSVSAKNCGKSFCLSISRLLVPALHIGLFGAAEALFRRDHQYPGRLAR